MPWRTASAFRARRLPGRRAAGRKAERRFSF